MEIGSEAVVLADTARGDCLIIGDGQDGSPPVQSKETGKFWTVRILLQVLESLSESLPQVVSQLVAVLVLDKKTPLICQ